MRCRVTGREHIYAFDGGGSCYCGTPQRQQKNYRVVLRGVAFTEVDMHATSEGEAMRKAEEWVRGVANGDLNYVDFDRAAWFGYEAEEAPE